MANKRKKIDELINIYLYGKDMPLGFIEWLPEKTGRAFLIQLNKYFELKYPNASEEIVNIITTDALEYINHNFDIEKIEQSIKERKKIHEKK